MFFYSTDSYEKKDPDSQFLSHFEIIPHNTMNLDPQKIKKEIEVFFNIDDLSRKCRKRIYVKARRVFSKIVYDCGVSIESKNKISLKNVGRLLGGQDHSTILHAKTSFVEEYGFYDDITIQADEILEILKTKGLVPQNYNY